MDDTPTQPSTAPEVKIAESISTAADPTLLCTLTCLTKNAQSMDLRMIEEPASEVEVSEDLKRKDEEHAIRFKQEWIFGRHNTCDGQLGNVKRVSNRHFRIWTRGPVQDHPNDPPIVLIEDLSTNGTFLNQQRLPKGRSCVLTHGDEIGVAMGVPTDEIRFLFRMGSAYLNMNSRRSGTSTAIGGEEGIHGKYDIGEILGKGAFAAVFKAIDRTSGEIFAVKRIPRKRIMAGLTVAREISILQSLDHKNIVRLQDYYEDKSTISLVMDYAAGGDLMDYIELYGALTEDLTRVIVKQTLQALAYVHSLGISHRDIKPDNIMLVRAGKQTPELVEIKVADFGLAKIADSGTVLKTFCGTLAYLAPEVIRTRESAKAARLSQQPRDKQSYSSAVDMWSLGCVIYVLLTTYLPFPASTQGGLCTEIMTGKYNTDLLKHSSLSSDACDFIRALIEVDPSLRPTAKSAMLLRWLMPINEGLSQLVHNPVAQSLEDFTSAANIPNEIQKATADLSLEQPLYTGAILVQSGSQLPMTSMIIESDEKDESSLAVAHEYHDGVRDFIPSQQPASDLNNGNDEEDGDDSIVPEAEVPPSMWMLLRTMEESIPYKDQVITAEISWFGRAPNCDIELNDIRASKIHCCILHYKVNDTKGSTTSYSPNADAKYRMLLCDFSLNGCSVNGRRIGQGNEVELENGDVIDMFRETNKNEKLTFQVELRRPKQYLHPRRPNGKITTKKSRIKIADKDGKLKDFTNWPSGKEIDVLSKKRQREEADEGPTSNSDQSGSSHSLHSRAVHAR
ncbi:kinase-like domain-containing protein [Lipomyces oligophaga]|uniref:kinase-like domain-containing protein n=1 Tax=Lipomyces oligophaga TaxID=45792 RepID=UPI0034CD554B